jgi:hypothetical protein
MRCVSFPAGATILQQGALPSADDQLYVLSEGRVDVVITGAVADASKSGEGVDRRGCCVCVHAIATRKHPRLVSRTCQ